SLLLAGLGGTALLAVALRRRCRNISIPTARAAPDRQLLSLRCSTATSRDENPDKTDCKEHGTRRFRYRGPESNERLVRAGPKDVIDVRRGECRKSRMRGRDGHVVAIRKANLVAADVRRSLPKVEEGIPIQGSHAGLLVTARRENAIS